MVLTPEEQADIEERFEQLEERNARLERLIRSGKAFTNNPLALATDLDDLGSVKTHIDFEEAPLDPVNPPADVLRMFAEDLDGVTKIFFLDSSGLKTHVVTVGGTMKSILKLTASVSTARATIITPTSGKRVRIVSCTIATSQAADEHYEVYFGTGAGITTTPANAIMLCVLGLTIGDHNFGQEWPDGGGPLGDVDEVVSIRTGDSDISGLGKFIIHYREE